MLDENVPTAVANMLTANGHQAEFVRDHVPPGSSDPLVATVSQDLDAILVSFDSDFQKIAARISPGQRRRFRRLSRIWLRCREGQASQRIESVLPFIEQELLIARQSAGGQMILQISKSWLRTDR